MQQISSVLAVLVGVSMGLSSCITSTIKSIPQVSGGSQTDSSGVKIFLLEREIPKDIEQLGVVSLLVNVSPALNVDQQVKQQLRTNCHRLGANGAFRISDGTYYPTVVSYLVFRYKK